MVISCNESKCKMQQITRKLNPVIASSYELNRHALGISTAEKDLGVVISNNLSSRDNRVCAVCSKSNRMLGFVRYNTRCIKNMSVLKTIHLIYVREVPPWVRNTSVGPSIYQTGLQAKIHPQSSISLSTIIIF